MGNGSDCTKKMNVLDATGLNLKASKAIQFMLCVFYHIKENTYLNIKYRCFIFIFHRSKANWTTSKEKLCINVKFQVKIGLPIKA